MSDDFLSHVRIRKMVSADVEALADAFELWNKPIEQFERYYLEQLLEKRTVLVAKHTTFGVTGYTTVLWESPYEYFWRRRIPEIVDLNVMMQHQRLGAGTALIKASEALAKQRGCSVMGISVVQDDSYTAAHRLYLALGYVPDGHGITPQDNELHLIKSL